MMFEILSDMLSPDSLIFQDIQVQNETDKIHKESLVYSVMPVNLKGRHNILVKLQGNNIISHIKTR